MVSSSKVRGWVAVSVAALVPMSGVVGAGSHEGLAPFAPPQQAAATPVQLPARANVGQAAQVQAAIQTTIDGGPVSLALTTSSSITNVGADGSYTARSTIDVIDVTNAPASADVAAWGFRDLQGVSFDQTYASTGVPIASTSRAVDAQSLVLDSVSMAYIGFPNEPILVGDSWNVDGMIGSEGLTFRVVYQCRLASVVDGTFTVDVSYAENFTSTVDDGVSNGTISGTGTLSGSLANPLMVWGGLNQTIDGVTTIDGVATPMRRDTSVSLTSLGE